MYMVQTLRVFPQAYGMGRALTQKLKELIPRQMFKIPIQVSGVSALNPPMVAEPVMPPSLCCVAEGRSQAKAQSHGLVPSLKVGHVAGHL